VSKASAWSFHDVGDGIKPAVAVDTNNIAHVSFLTENLAGAVFHAMYNESLNVFEVDTVSTGYFYGPCDIEIDQLGRPHVSYHDHGLGGDLAHLVLSVSSWDTLPVHHEGHDGWDSEIAFDSENNTHIISIDPPIGSQGNGLEYAVYKGGKWTIESLNTRKGLNYGFGIGFQMDQNDIPLVSYYDDAETHLYYGNRSTGTWELNKIDSVGDVGKYSSMIVDEQNDVHLCYVEILSIDSTVLHYNHLSGGSWNRIALDTLKGVSPSARKVLSLQMDSKGMLHVIYGTDSELVYLIQDSLTWNKEVIVDKALTGVELAEGMRFKLDKNDNAHLVYYQKDAVSNSGFKIRYATNSSNVANSIKDKTSKHDKIKVFPNPFSSRLVVNRLVSNSVVKLFNNHGQQVFRFISQTDNLEINTSNLQIGMYFLQVINDGSVSKLKVLKH
jgi:hypothetical protein